MSREVVLTEEEIEAKVEEFALWIKEQPNMPQDLGKFGSFESFWVKTAINLDEV